MSEESREFTRIVDSLIPLVEIDPRIWVIWVEGDRLEDVRRPYAALDLRLGVMDPDFQAVRLAIPDLVASAGRARVASDPREIPFDGVAWRAESLGSGRAFDLTLERMSLVGKKPRAFVTPIVDRTGRFRAVLNRTGTRA